MRAATALPRPDRTRPARARRASRTRVRRAFARRVRRAGFTLLEVISAMSIFFLIVSLSLWSMAAADDQTLSAERSRQLQVLAESRMGALAIFESHYDETPSLSGQRFEDLPESLRDTYEGWTWDLEIQDTTAFGVQEDPNAPYLFESSGGTTTGTGTTGSTGGDTGGSGGTAQKKGKAQILRQLVLVIRSPDEDGTQDTLELVTFLPVVPKKSSAPPAGSGN